MVHLTITPAILAAIEACQTLDATFLSSARLPPEPPLGVPVVGQAISHRQIIAISRYLREDHHGTSEKALPDSPQLPPYHLEDLLRGSRIYVQSAKPKSEQTPEYKALMARLRREEEARAYERMTSPPLATESILNRFPAPAQAKLFSPVAQADTEQDDEVTYADVNRQMALIMNILLSIVACSVAIWLVSSHWSTPKRLGLSMGGSGMIGVAEVVVYAGYLRRIKEAKTKAQKEVEVKEVIDTWVIGGPGEKSTSASSRRTLPNDTLDVSVRRRKGRG